MRNDNEIAKVHLCQTTCGAFLSVLLLLGELPVAPPTGQMGAQVGGTGAPSVNTVDYIQFGSYNSAPILFADWILTIRAFDAKRDYHTGVSDSS
jgi:hypothetical protein